MEKISIEAEFVSIHCYVGAKGQLFDTFATIKSWRKNQASKPNIKIVFLVFNLSLKEYTTFYEHLKQSYSEQFKQYFINILMVKDRSEVEENIERIRKVNQPEFQYNYMKLQQHSQRSLRLDIVDNYISSKFKWNKVKAKYFLEKNNITSMRDLLEYGRFPYYENSIVEKTKQFRDYCEAAIVSMQNEEGR